MTAHVHKALLEIRTVIYSDDIVSEKWAVPLIDFFDLPYLASMGTMLISIRSLSRITVKASGRRENHQAIP
jgi:hypothetical protein